ncbi:cysteine hydrolase family protein [Tenuibacillus multivorans]|uniref:Nicotinamidase-related amidase n=1 Tax=Tenuibacillus multivorans TaxID=237069 RepID=A0A1H0AVY0_9BACI|nr:isochorismatase family protein [Tenuibacillus multivorans]GEL77798.1 isochorismatase [Tenuibacillus multivorans]SDN37481.1 Nicotinamidase-related amidase [Tenuibacillus multivorans]
MKALLVIDVQKSIVNFKDFTDELSKIEHIMKDFKKNSEPIIFMRHVDDVKDSPLYRHSEGSELYSPLKHYADHIVEKTTPSSFYQTDLSNLLEKLGVNHVYITGFNTEFCCLFTAISGFDRGYDVTFIEDATGTVNDENTYEMKGLDIRDFVGTALHWSNTIEVLEFDEYLEEYHV